MSCTQSVSNDSSLSAILGIIIVTAIIIIVSALVYYYIESRESSYRSISGVVLNIERNQSIPFMWDVILRENSGEAVYRMIFNDTYPPKEGLTLRFYYTTITLEGVECLDIHSIEEIQGE